MRYLLATTLFLACAVGCARSLLTPARSDDTGITNLISRRLTADRRLCAYAITVAVHDRTARLEGKVASEADRRRADQLAREAGATRVEDLLVIDPAAGERAMC